MADEDNDNGVDTSNLSVEEMTELQKQNCIFCKIAKKQIPAKILHEDDKIICILDINPASEGHILVYPKEHYMILPHIPEDVTTHLMRVVKLMSNTLLKTLQCKGTSIFIANGMAAGQKAPHVLVHVFPRREGDGLLDLPKYELSPEQIINFQKLMYPFMHKFFGDGTIKRMEDNKMPVKDLKTTKDEAKPQHTQNIKKPEDTKSDKKEAKKPAKKSTDNNNNNNNNKTSKDKNVDLDDIARLFGG